MAVSSTYGLKPGDPGIKAVGPLAFGPEGILFVADNISRTITALDVNDTAAPEGVQTINVDKLDTRLAAYLGCPREDVLIKDMAVHPTSQNVYISVMRGTGASATPVLARIDASGTISDVALENVPFAQTAIGDGPAPDNERTEWRLVQGNREGEPTTRRDGVTMRVARDPITTLTVTDMAYVDGQLVVAGASNEEFSSTLRRIAFPFQGNTVSNSLEIYHVSHRRWETASPIITFAPVRNNAALVAGYMCTPVVHFSMKDLEPGAHVKGRTVAEFGSWNSPVDIVSYTQNGEEYVLVSNAGMPVMKIACSDIDRQEALTGGEGPSGVARQPLPQEGVGQMARLNGSYVLMMSHDSDGNASLHSHSIASL